jgi:glyoxylase-like metal-dependent hydrolase (beta-lactamase superfamily II)
MFRRDFLKTTSRLAATAGLLRFPLASAAAESDSLFRWERIRPDAWVVFNGGGNVLVIADRAGAIIVDCKINGMGQLLRAEIESRVGPIAAIVITHHHGDHSGGYPAFTGARAIAHAAALPRIRARAERLAGTARSTPNVLADSLLDSLAKDFDVPRGPAAERAVATDLARIVSADPATCVPTEHFADRSELRIGNTTLELMHAGPAHTDNDVVVRDLRRSILHAGDLLFHRLHPSIDDTAGGTIRGWLEALGDVRRACNEETVVIAGHGATGTRAALDEQATYFNRLRDFVSRERAAGRSREDILQLANTLFPAYGFTGEWSANLGIAFDELEKVKNAVD